MENKNSSKIRLVPVHSDVDSDRKKALNFLRKYYPSPTPLTDDEIQDGAVHLFWAYQGKDKTPFGITGYKKKTENLAESVRTTVATSYRGKGLGEALSKAIESYLKRKGFSKIMTTIYTTNIAMIVIKLKQGYKFEGIHPNHEAPGLDEYSLGKML